jgi:GNAT superfamily N-acetyltransferase
VTSKPSISDSLPRGVLIPDKTGHDIAYRYLRRNDDIDVITDLLHDAYAPLAAQGMRFAASHQDSVMTRWRMARGETIVADDQGTVIGVITLKDAGKTHGSPFYERADVAGFGQFAVKPEYQGNGVGRTLLELVERRAREQGVAHLALDTSEHAKDLIAFYESKGYRFVEYLQWPDTNYRSVVLSKSL